MSQSFSIKKDLSLDNLYARNIATGPVKSSVSSQDALSLISSGSWTINSEVDPWTNPVVEISSAKYIILAGVQHISVTGTIRMDSTSSQGTLLFSTPFFTEPEVLYGGSSVCHPGDLSSIIPSIVECIDGKVLLTILLSSPSTRVDFNLMVMAGISGFANTPPPV